MAKADIKMPDEFLERLSRLGGRTDAVAEKVLEAGGAVVLESVKTKLSAAVGKGTKYKSRSTGELESAIGLSSRSDFPNRTPAALPTRSLPICSNTAKAVKPHVRF